MTTTTVLHERVWILQNKLNPFPVAALLDWDGTTLTLSLDAMSADCFHGWVAKRLDAHQEMLEASLRAGEATTVFSLPVSEFTTSWPRSMAGAAIEVTVGEQRWLLCMEAPSGGAIFQTIALISGRKKAKVWRTALAAAAA